MRRARRGGGTEFATARNPRDLAFLPASDRLRVAALEVTDLAAARAAVAVATTAFGRLDVVVDNVGYGRLNSIEDQPEAEFRGQIETTSSESTRHARRTARDARAA